MSFVDQGTAISSMVVFGVGLAAAFALRGWKTPTGAEYSERHHTKLYALGVSLFAMFTYWLCMIMGNHSFGHILLAGHQINVGIYTAWIFVNTGFAIVVGLSYSEVEHYAYIGGLIQATASTLLLIGVCLADITNVPLAVTILSFVFQAAACLYIWGFCVPNKDWQEKHCSNVQLIVKGVILLMFLFYPAAFSYDNTFKNSFHDNEKKNAIINIAIQAVHQVLFGIYLLWLIDVLPTPPVFQVAQSLGGMLSGGAGQSYIQVQQLAPTDGASAPAVASAPVTVPSSAPIKYNLRMP